MDRAPLRRILLVEDEIDIQLVARLALERHDRFEVAIAGSGEEALELARTFQPQMVLLDVMMPGLDGFGTLAGLRRLPGLAEVPVVFVTARAQSHEVAEYRALGALEVIIKPFDPISLGTLLEEVWQQHLGSGS